MLIIYYTGRGYMIIKNGTVLMPDYSFKNVPVSVRQEKIYGFDTLSADNDIIDASGLYVVPGFIDIHMHGALGHPTVESSLSSLESISRFYAGHGTTSLVLAVHTVPLQSLHSALQNIRDYKERITGGANILGAYIEGIFISPEKRGSHNPKYIVPPTREAIDSITGFGKNTVRIFIIAPEMDASGEIIKHIASMGITVAIGHSNSGYDQAIRGIENGATLATHTFNAMRALSHREPGIAGAVLTDERVSCEIIADGIHLHPAIVKLIVQAKGPDKVILVTDAQMLNGLPDGEYCAGETKLTMKDGFVRTENGTLSGSTCTMDKAVRNVMKFAGVPLEQAVKMASENPAKAAGVFQSKGSIEAGKDADFTLLDKDCNVVKTIVKGHVVFEA